MDIAEKLAALRSLMRGREIAAYLIPTEDFHSSEYVGAYFKTREYMSGFTGSAGTLVVLMEEAALWTDGRYFLQAEDQLAGTGIALMRMGEKDVPTIAEFIAEKFPEGGKVGFDGRTVTERFVKEIAEKSGENKIMFYGEEDLAGMVWKDRPPMSKEPVWELEERYAGLSREKKLANVREKMAEEKADSLFLAALDEIAWLLNLRGGDVLYTPVFLAYMLIARDKATLFVNESILPAAIRNGLAEAGVTVMPYEAVEEELCKLSEKERVWVDTGIVNYRLLGCLQKTVKIDSPSPVALMKAVKTPTEMEHMRKAHVKDGVALTRFMRWLKMTVGKERVTELGAVKRLEAFREQMEGYLGPSFEPIIAYGAHGAIVHYEPTAETDAEMKAESFCLADTGGHYREGTTDVTRTIALGTLTAEEKEAYTLALRGHLRLGAAEFLYGACGHNLDILARQPLWEKGMDYNHGTGHGVGFLLNVHEGPQRIHWRLPKDAAPTPLEEGMIISNEPGLYLTDKFGIRHENLVLCRKGKENAYGQFMYFEPLTMAPFDRDAIEPSLMTQEELAWLNAYHRKVCETLSPYFEGEEKAWLEEVTAEIGRQA